MQNQRHQICAQIELRILGSLYVPNPAHQLVNYAGATGRPTSIHWTFPESPFRVCSGELLTILIELGQPYKKPYPRLTPGTLLALYVQLQEAIGECSSLFSACTAQQLKPALQQSQAESDAIQGALCV